MILTGPRLRSGVVAVAKSLFSRNPFAAVSQNSISPSLHGIVALSDG